MTGSGGCCTGALLSCHKVAASCQASQCNALLLHLSLHGCIVQRKPLAATPCRDHNSSTLESLAQDAVLPTFAGLTLLPCFDSGHSADSDVTSMTKISDRVLLMLF